MHRASLKLLNINVHPGGLIEAALPNPHLYLNPLPTTLNPPVSTRFKFPTRPRWNAALQKIQNPTPKPL